jgi:NitT/TauT family transport system substrate-binding protein
MMNTVNRRDFLAQSTALAGASLLPFSNSVQAEPPPEVKKIRLIGGPRYGICLAPQYVAEELLRLEGFSEVEYARPAGGAADPSLLTTNQVDISSEGAPALVQAIDRGQHIVVLAGIHAGCYDLIASERVQHIRDLKGKTVAVIAMGSVDQVFIASMAAYVGIDPRKDIDWLIAETGAGAMQAFLESKADAFLAFAPQGLEMRAKKVGHVLVNTTQDRPWSQYFCCMATARQEFVQKYPIAAKRALRAILKAIDICAREPERAARFLVDKGYESDYETSLVVLKDLPYTRWRQADPGDTLRFHALRLREVGIIKSTPQNIIAQGTDWRFLNELKKELKA